MSARLSGRTAALAAVVIVSLASACGRVGFAPTSGDTSRPDDGATATDDGATDGDATTTDGGATVTCWPTWFDGTVTFSPPVPLALGFPVVSEPSMSPDMLTLYFGAPNPTSYDIFAITRTAVGGPWSSPSPVSALNSSSNDDRVTFSADGLTAIVASDRPGGGGGGYNLWRATRASVSDPFGALSTTGIEQLNTNADEYGADFGGTNLYLSRYAMGMPSTIVESAASSAATATATFAATTGVTGLPAGFIHTDPTMSPDAQVMVFGYSMSSDETQLDMYYAVRAAPGQPFEPAVVVPGVNAPSAEDDDEDISADGCELYFGTYRDNAQHREQIYTATVVH